MFQILRNFDYYIIYIEYIYYIVIYNIIYYRKKLFKILIITYLRIIEIEDAF